MAMVDLAWQKPNGSEPMMDDSDDIDQRDILTLAAAVFRDGVLKSAGYPKMDFDSLWMVGAADAEAYDNLPAIYPEKRTLPLPTAGIMCSATGGAQRLLGYASTVGCWVQVTVMPTSCILICPHSVRTF